MIPFEAEFDNAAHKWLEHILRRLDLLNARAWAVKVSAPKPCSPWNGRCCGRRVSFFKYPANEGSGHAYVSGLVIPTTTDINDGGIERE